MPRKNYDYSKYTPAVEDNILQRVSAMAQKQWELAKKVAEAEEKLAEAKTEFKLVAEVEFPELMQEAGQKELTTDNGIKVSLEETIRPSIPEEHSVAAYTWLEDHGYGKMIKRVFTLALPKGEKVLAAQFEKVLAEAGLQLPIQKKLNIHPSTLASLVRTGLEEGVAFPDGLINIFIQKHVKLKGVK